MLAQITHTLLLALLFVCTFSPAQAEDVAYTRFTVDLGEIVNTDDGLTVLANEQGQVLLRVPAANLELDPNQRVRFRFGGQPPAEIYLLWQPEGAGQLLQHGFVNYGNPTPFIELNTVAGWEGRVEHLQFGFLVAPNAEVTLRDVRISLPRWSDKLSDTVASWLVFRPWIPRDINVYTGTRDFNVGPFPAPVIAAGIALLLACYLLLRRRQARWTVIALLVFCGWLVLDGLWQWRLWQQLEVTRDRYAGVDSERKPLVSEDALIARFAARAAEQINRDDARVFIASMSDSDGMRAAYYMSPLNTYWNRRGIELPEKRYLRQGDYILVVGGSRLLYNRGLGLVRLPSGEDVAVHERLVDNVGLLLEVKE